MLVCMAIIIGKIDVDWGTAFKGFIPSKALVASGALYTCQSASSEIMVH